MNALHALRHGFPGPRLAGVAFILAPALLMAGSYLLHPTAASPESHFLSYQPDAGRAPYGINLFMGGAVFAAIAGVALARLSIAKERALATLGGFLVVAWAATGAFFGGVMWVEVALTRAGESASSAAGAAAGLMPIPALVGTLGLLTGWAVLAFAGWRAGVFGAARAAALGMMCLIPVAVAFAGRPLLATIPLAGMAVALVPLGLSLLRGDDGEAEAAAAPARA